MDRQTGVDVVVDLGGFTRIGSPGRRTFLTVVAIPHRHGSTMVVIMKLGRSRAGCVLTAVIVLALTGCRNADADTVTPTPTATTEQSVTGGRDSAAGNGTADSGDAATGGHGRKTGGGRQEPGDVEIPGLDGASTQSSPSRSIPEGEIPGVTNPPTRIPDGEIPGVSVTGTQPGTHPGSAPTNYDTSNGDTSPTNRVTATD